MKRFYFYLLVVFFTTSLISTAHAQVTVTATAAVLGPNLYPTLNDAFIAINAGTHQGMVTVSIGSNTVETGACVLNSSGAGPANYTGVVIRPSVDGVSISGATAGGRGLIELNGADNVTIDGDNPNTGGINRNLSIINTAANTTAFTSCIRMAVSSLVTTCDNVTIQNCNINGSGTGGNVPANTTELVTWGILFSGQASSSSATTSPSPMSSATVTAGSPATAANLLISNNNIQTVSRGISIGGAATTVAPGLVISNNTIGNPVTGNADQVWSYGMTVQGSANAVISRNTISVEGYIRSTTTTKGIDIGLLSSASTGIIISGNIIERVINNDQETWPANGINLTGGNDHKIFNNFIGTCRQSQVAGTGGFSPIFGVSGIRINAGTGHSIEYNTVHFTGNQPGATNTSLVTCLSIVNATSTGMNIRNNIFSNQLTGGNPTSFSTTFTCVYLPNGATSSMNLNWNNNVYYQGSTPYSLIAKLGTTVGADNYTATGFDPLLTTPSTNFRAYTSSLSVAGTNDNLSLASTVAPPFISSSNLHINNTAPNAINLEGKAVVVAGVTTDFDGDARHLTAPDIGADEFVIVGCVTANGGTISPATHQLCEGQTVGLTSTGATADVGITYQWKVSTTSGGPYTNVIGGTGANTVSYTTDPLVAGTYYYVLQTTCAMGPVSALSNQVTVTVNPNPTANASATLACVGSAINFTGSSDIGTTFGWTGPDGFTSTSQNPTLISATNLSMGNYIFTATSNGCSTTDTVIVTVGVNPSGVTASSSDNIICTGDTIDLSSSVTVLTNVMSEDFNTNAPAWTVVSAPSAPGVTNWAPVPSPFSIASGSLNFINFSTPEGGTFFMANSDAGGSGSTTNTTLISPVFSTVGLTSANLSFEHLYQRWASGDINVSVDISTNNGSSWSNLVVYTSDQGTTAANAQSAATANINMSAYVNQPHVKIRFNYVAVWGYYWIIDNVKVSGDQTFSYDWASAPAGFTSNSQNNTDIIPTSTTTYSVAITNGLGCLATDTAMVTVNSLPAVDYTVAANDTVCSGDNVVLSGTGAVSYIWTGGVTDATPFTPSLGSTTYTVTGTDVNGCTGTSSASIFVNNLPTVSYTLSSNDTICNGDNITLSGTGASSYLWTGGVTDAVSFTPGASLTYTVTGTDASGCTNTASAPIVVNTLPTVSYTVITNDTICSGDNITLSGTGASSYLWTGGVTDAVSFIPGGSLTYTVTGTDVNGCTNSASAPIFVNSSPNVSYTATANDTICPGDNVTLSGTGAASYMWTGGISDAVSFTPGGSLTYTVTGTDMNGCTNTASAPIVVGTIPTVDLGPDVVQPNPPALLDAGSGFSSYLWSTTSNTQDISVNSNGQYIVTVTNIFGCLDSDTINVNFTSGVVNIDGTPTLFTLYPNPTSNGVFNISIENIETPKLVMEVLDMTGRVVYNKYIGSANGNVIEPFSLTELRTGTYVMRITANGKSTNLRFIINK